MTTLTQPLREEHQELYPHIEALRQAADAVSETVTPALRAAVHEAYDFLLHHLIPHAQAEDRALYPTIQKVIGAAEATATMSRDHVEVGRITAELGGLQAILGAQKLTTDQANALRRVLYGLYALVKVHFAKEEEVYLPLLDARLSQDQAHAMFVAMESAAHEAKQIHAH
jgi:iron-sulfur cluster repair protein YtfE (RIC family)